MPGRMVVKIVLFRAALRAYGAPEKKTNGRARNRRKIKELRKKRKKKQSERERGKRSKNSYRMKNKETEKKDPNIYTYIIHRAVVWENVFWRISST